ncbi:DUF2690 domain-containing protein [Streptomyces montanisoli]|uniref:DUF2690 domain-containing protein n=1 Tax=Streptomyces montanisoli TaxID=2798581 RepID=A0A940S0P0_9ACTN|nr:DUF2690 domain-containing protein [Streptomyces montanisoli]MBP0461079.1 DUF2690 domain-containing protein [Streptomyces montanisoli]
MARRGTDPAGELADRIRELIDRSGLSLDAVAARTGRGRHEWDAYVRGLRRPSREATAALAEALGTQRDPLLQLWDRAESHAPASVTGEGGRPAPSRRGTGHPHAPRHSRPGGRPHGDRRPRHARTGTLVATAVGVALVVLAVVLLTGLGGGDGHTAAAGSRTSPAAPGGHGGSGRSGGKAAAPAPAPTATDPAATASPSPSASASASAGPSLPGGVRCAPGACAGEDPEATGCAGGNASTLAAARVGGAYVEVRYSATCRAAWARVTGAPSGATLRITPGGSPVAAGAEADAGAGVGTYTPMVAAADPHGLRACLTPAHGPRGCASAR